MAGFLGYAVLRSLYVLLALGAIWGSLLWGPWLSLPLAIVILHLVTYVERWTGPSPPDLVTAPAWFGRWLSHPEDAHGLLFCFLHFAAIGSAFAPLGKGFDQAGNGPYPLGRIFLLGKEAYLLGGEELRPTHSGRCPAEKEHGPIGQGGLPGPSRDGPGRIGRSHP